MFENRPTSNVLPAPKTLKEKAEVTDPIKGTPFRQDIVYMQVYLGEQ